MREGLITLTIRTATPDDAAHCGRIIYEAFAAIANRHSFPADFPSVEVATGIASMPIADSRFYAAVAHENGRVLGSNFLDQRSAALAPSRSIPRPRTRGSGDG